MTGSADGQWPVFGVASTTDGVWQLARGPGWVNQWTAAELGLPSGDPDQPTCQATGPDTRACLGLAEHEGIGDEVQQPLGQVDLRAGGEEVGDVAERGQLLGHGLHERRMTVAADSLEYGDKR